VATRYVENVPDELYEAFRQRVREVRRLIAAEVLSLLRQNVPTAKQLRVRRGVFQKIVKLHSGKQSRKRFASTEGLERERRAR
jgi:hypothetical protein